MRRSKAGAPGTSSRGRSGTGASAIIWRENGGENCKHAGRDVQHPEERGSGSGAPEGRESTGGARNCSQGKHTRTNRTETGSYSTSRENWRSHRQSREKQQKNHLKETVALRQRLVADWRAADITVGGAGGYSGGGHGGGSR